MTNLRAFLRVAAGHLQAPLSTTECCGSTPGERPRLRSWCSWTTFGRLQADAGYWTAELPREEELGETHTHDGGTWGQPFAYVNDLAHIIIPKQFIEEPCAAPFRQWVHEQDVDGLSQLLTAAELRHHLSPYGLEVKLF